MPPYVMLCAPFSILYRIEWVETILVEGYKLLIRSFSILYRIEWVETPVFSVSA